MKKTTPENQVKNEVMEYLTRVKNGYFWVTQSMGVFDPVSRRFRKPGKWVVPGVADVLGIYRSITMAMELKSKHGTLSEAQRDFLLNINANGGVAGVVKSRQDAIDLLIVADELAEMREKWMLESSPNILRNDPKNTETQ